MGFRSLTETWSARTSVRGELRGSGWLRSAVAAASTGLGLCGTRGLGLEEREFRLVGRVARVVQDGGCFGDKRPAMTGAACGNGKRAKAAVMRYGY
jgi:hypothetical protein